MKSFKQLLCEVKKLKIRPRFSEKSGSEYVKTKAGFKEIKLRPLFGFGASGRFASAVDSFVDRINRNPEYQSHRNLYPSAAVGYESNFLNNFKTKVRNRHNKFYDRLAFQTGAENYSKRLNPEFKKVKPYTATQEYTSSITNQLIHNHVAMLFANKEHKNKFKDIISSIQSHRHEADKLSAEQLQREVEGVARGKRYIAPHDMILYRIQTEHPHEETESERTSIGKKISSNKRSHTYSTTRFHSFTTNPEQLTKFSTFNKDQIGKQHVIRLHVPKGTELQIPHHASIYEENEITLPPGTEINIGKKSSTFELTVPEEYKSKSGTAGSMWTAGIVRMPPKKEVVGNLKKLWKESQ